MGRRFQGNREPISKMQIKRRRMRRLYLKGLEARSYYYYMDAIPQEVVDAVKHDIRRRFRAIRVRLWLRTVLLFVVITAVLWAVVVLAGNL